MQNNLLKERYLREAESFRILEEKEEKALLVLSLLRLVIFIGGFILVWFVFTLSIIAGSLLLPVIVILFLYLLKLYSERSEKKAFLGNLVTINRNEADAVTGDLSSFEAGSSYTDPHHRFSNDVDLFGQNSLFQYLNRTVTGYGRDILAGWLSDPFPLSDDLILRQEAIRELAAKGEVAPSVYGFRDEEAS